jgi:hypothetical protein
MLAAASSARWCIVVKEEVATRPGAGGAGDGVGHRRFGSRRSRLWRLQRATRPNANKVVTAMQGHADLVDDGVFEAAKRPVLTMALLT